MAIETLRPNGAGNETNIASQNPGMGGHYDKVDEVTADNATTTVYTTNQYSFERDLYGLPAHSGSGTISSIKIYFKVMSTFTGYYAMPILRIGSTTYDGSIINFALATA